MEIPQEQRGRLLFWPGDKCISRNHKGKSLVKNYPENCLSVKSEQSYKAFPSRAPKG